MKSSFLIFTCAAELYTWLCNEYCKNYGFEHRYKTRSLIDNDFLYVENRSGDPLIAIANPQLDCQCEQKIKFHACRLPYRNAAKNYAEEGDNQCEIHGQCMLCIVGDRRSVSHRKNRIHITQQC